MADISLQAIEAAARAAYDACHPDDSFDALQHRARFSKEDRCLLRDWLAASESRLKRQQALADSVAGSRSSGQ